MNEYQRVDLLVKILEGDNAKAFAMKTGIPESSLCRIRKGQGKPASYYDKILASYPQVRSQWLYAGTGEPLKERNEKGEILKKVESLERDVKKLTKLVEQLLGGAS